MVSLNSQRTIENATGGIDAAATAGVVGALLCWSVGPLFIRYLRLHLDAWSQNLWRYAFALLFLLPFLIYAARRGKVPGRTWTRAIFPSCANIVMQCFWAWSFYHLEPGFGSLLARSSLIWTAAFTLALFPDERGLVRSKRFWAGLALCLAGVVGVTVGRQGFAARGDLIGIALILCSAITWAMYIVSARAAFADIDSRIGFGVVSVYTVAGLAVIAVIFGHPQKILRLSVWPWACVIISGIVCISLAHTLYYAAMRRIGAMIPSMVLSVVPFMVLLLSMIFFNERLSAFQLLSGVVLVAGSILALWAQEHLRRDTSRSGAD